MKGNRTSNLSVCFRTYTPLCCKHFSLQRYIYTRLPMRLVHLYTGENIIIPPVRILKLIKVFFADCLAWKTFNMATMSLKERAQVILVTNKRRTLQWPAQSIDLNPSKHVWDILKRNVRAQPKCISVNKWWIASRVEECQVNAFMLYTRPNYHGVVWEHCSDTHEWSIWTDSLQNRSYMCI